MKIFFDDQIFEQKYGGISRYFCELIAQLEKDKEILWELGVKCSENAYILNSSLFHADKILSLNKFCFGLNFKGKYRIYKSLGKHHLINNLSTNRAFSSKMVKKGEYDLFHPTYYDPYFLKYLNNKPFVLTIYDMVHELYQTQFLKEDLTSTNKRLLAGKADAIIAISENTKKDIIRLYGFKPEKIKVIHLGNSLVCSDSNPDIKLPSKYVLYIGTRYQYKNFRRFVNAMIPLLKQDENLHLVCGGGNVFNLEETNFFKSLSCGSRVIHQQVLDDKTLVSLYKKAAAFVFPSLYEGFGIPVLEAFSCGCPVVLSNSSSLPEVGADAAEYFNPEDELSIMNAVKKVIYDENKRNELVKRGFERLEYFSWEKTASATKEVYESLL